MNTRKAKKTTLPYYNCFLVDNTMIIDVCIAKDSLSFSIFNTLMEVLVVAYSAEEPRQDPVCYE